MLHVGAKCQHLSCNAGHCHLAHGVHWDAVFIHPQRDMPSRPSPFLKPSQNKEREYSHLKSVSPACFIILIRRENREQLEGTTQHFSPVILIRRKNSCTAE